MRDEEEDWIQLMEHPEKVPKEDKIHRYVCRPCVNFFELEIKGEPETDEEE